MRLLWLIRGVTAFIHLRRRKKRWYQKMINKKEKKAILLGIVFTVALKSLKNYPKTSLHRE